MDGIDPNAINALGQSESLWSQAGKSLTEHPEKYAIALDMLGKGIDPNNPFAGIGTMLGKSQLASKAEQAGQEQSQNMFKQLMAALTPGPQKGPSTMKTSIGDDGLIDYTITGREGSGMDTTVMPGVKPETREFFTDKDFLKDFGGGGS